MNPKPRLMKQLLLLSLALLLWCSSLALPAPRAEAFSYGYLGTPKDTIGVTKPTLTFYFKTDMTGVTPAYSMTLNGESVQAVYNKDKGTFTYTPGKDLTPGSYLVSMSITFPGYKPINESWTFTVAKDALRQLPAASSEQLAGISALNDYRVLHGLPAVQMDDSLNATAMAHAKYLDLNKIRQSESSQESLHSETSGKAGFVGATPLERGAYFGYTSSIGEDAALITGSISDAIDALYDAPYHRSPIIDPTVKEVGIGRVGDYTIIEFGMEKKNTSQLVVSPAEGDRYVPTTFEGNETPDPLRIHANETYPVGYPIMAQYYGEEVGSIKLLSAELTDSNKNTVELLTNTPDTDTDLSKTVILMPRKPLQADTSYHVKLRLQVMKDGSTVTEEKAWDFTTEPADGTGKKKLHLNATDYKKYYVTAAPTQRVASFGLDDSSYQLDGIAFPMKRTPVIVDGSSFLYIRDLAAALGATVDWDEQQRAAIYTKGSLKVTLYTAKTQYEVNGQLKTTDTPARLIGENTMVPVRLLAEVLGAKVDYIEATRTVKLTY
ncbi:stalk domain-containing protein [Paenibacillus rigui]|uniref:S-layer protein n=1 Tax=Paenibacillus rigui TaxID=554312 RepID=A0A229UN52_9BACL|nr:stalk domain-containing protein [Paenibacillus rigui]OXM84802.1 S-layer protein [Paenibacillus rigui]